MLTTLVVMTLLVGIFIGANSTVLIANYMDKREEQKLAEDRHPSNTSKDEFDKIMEATKFD